MTRRELLLAGAVAPAVLEGTTPIKQLGLDLFSLRSQGWTAFQLLDFAHAHGAAVVNFSEPRFLGSTDSDHLKRVREHAESLGLRIEVGFGSICPTSTRFVQEDGSAREQLLRMFGIARILGSPFVRCYLGSAEERKGEIPLEQHIDNTIAACRSVRDEDGRHGIKIAVENHAGDLQAQQLRELVEEAGTDYVGTLLDAGNATWTLEDPFHTLEVLAALALTTGIRDSRIWIEDGAVNVMWVPMGQGNIGMQRLGPAVLRTQARPGVFPRDHQSPLGPQVRCARQGVLETLPGRACLGVPGIHGTGPRGRTLRASQRRSC